MQNRPINARQQQKYDSSTNWATNNPILLAGEIGVESDTNKIKIGNGSLNWNNLDYIGGGGSIVVDDELSATSENPVQNKVVYETIQDIKDNKLDKFSNQFIARFTTSTSQYYAWGTRKYLEIGWLNLPSTQGFGQLTISGTMAASGFSMTPYTEKIFICSNNADYIVNSLTTPETNESRVRLSGRQYYLVVTVPCDITFEYVSNGGTPDFTLNLLDSLPSSSTTPTPVTKNTLDSYFGEKFASQESISTLQTQVTQNTNNISTNISDIASLQTTKQDTLTAGANISIENNVISATGGSEIIIDDALSTTSENPVQNKIITNSINSLERLYQIIYISNQGGSLELGRYNLDGTARTPFIDFHTDGASDTDFNVRLLAVGNDLTVSASNFRASGNVVVSGAIYLA